MNSGTGVSRKRPGAALRPAPCTGAQLSLALEADYRNEDALRAAWTRSGLSMPYQVALRNRPLAICLSCLADAMRRKVGMDRHGAAGARGAKRRSR